MFTTGKRLIWCVLAIVRARFVALTVVTLVATIVLGGNLCGRIRYSVEDDWDVDVYGMPFPYKILRGESVYLDLSAPPGDRPPVLLFDCGAALGDAVIGLLLLSVLFVLFSRFRLRFWISRQHSVRSMFVLTAVFAVICSAFVMERDAYRRQRDVLAKIKRCGGTVWAEYPVPHVLWSRIPDLVGRWFSQDEVIDFLDASMGTVVRLDGSPEVLSYVEKLPTLRAIDIRDDPESVQQYVPARLSPETAPQLERIKIELGRIENLPDIIELPRLRFLTILGYPEIESLRALNDLTNLESLELIWCEIPKEGIVQFDKLTNLRVLVPGRITDTMLRSIGKLPCLEELYLGGNDGLTDEGITGLQDVQSLRRLDLEGCRRISDSAMKTLKRLTELRYLNVWHTSITDAGLRNLASLPELEELVLGSTRVTSRGLSVLATLPHLKTLNLCGTTVDDRVGLALHDLTGLESLNLSGTKITDQGVANLRDLKSLRSLNLSNTKITDRCVPSLLEMTLLREVHLNMTGVTAGGAAQLQSLPELRRLKVYDCPAIDSATLTILQKQMPNVDILEPVHDTGNSVPSSTDSKHSTTD